MKKFTYILTVLILTIFMYNPAIVYAGPSNHSNSTHDTKCMKYTNQTACENAKEDDEKCYWDSKTSSCKKSNGNYRYDDEKEDDENSNVPGFLQPDNEVSCGNLKKIPDYIPFITSLTITILTIISMGMLVIMGTIDLFKGVNSGNPDEMKKCQKAFFNRLGSAVLLFFIVALTKLLVGLVNSTAAGGSGIVECISCFINNKCA